MEGAVGGVLDRALWIFGDKVESEMQTAAANANGPMFQRSAQLRTFARLMGDDMNTSTAGFASPAVHGGSNSEEDGEILMSGF